MKAVETGRLTPRISSEQDAQPSAQYERRRLKTKYLQQQNDEQNKVSI